MRYYIYNIYDKLFAQLFNSSFHTPSIFLPVRGGKGWSQWALSAPLEIGVGEGGGVATTDAEPAL